MNFSFPSRITTATVTFFTTPVLSRFIGYFEVKNTIAKRCRREEVGGGKYEYSVVELCPTTPRKMSKGNYERYKFLTECLSFIHTL